MIVNSLRVFVGVLVFGLLLGASSTAFADTVSITSITFSNLQFTPAAGTAVFTPTGASARAQVTNTLGENQNVVSNTFPLAQATASVTSASATGMANAADRTASGNSSVSVGSCTCTATSFAFDTFTGTLVIVGGEGSVDVNISFLLAAMGQVATDQFGQFAHSNMLFNLTVNGRSEFSNDMLIEVTGPNQTGQFQLIALSPRSRVLTLQFGAVNTIAISVSVVSAGVNEVPEPATVVLLVSGLGSMIGVLKKRRKQK